MLNDTQEVRTSHEPRQKSSPLYLLTGLILGLILGLVYAWVINPVIYENTAPASLGDANKDFYRSTIAQVYAVTGDLERAFLRLTLLEDPDPVYALGVQAQRALAEGQDEEARRLALLASALQGLPQFQEPTPESTPLPPTPTNSPPPSVPTHTLPIPTMTP
jgi:hypothetical protein